MLYAILSALAAFLIALPLASFAAAWAISLRDSTLTPDGKRLAIMAVVCLSLGLSLIAYLDVYYGTPR